MAKAGVNIPIVSDWDSKGIKRAMEDFKKLETTGQKVSFAMQKALVPATAAIAGLAAAATVATKAAIEDQKQQDELARQLEVTTGATAEQVAAVEDYIAKTEMAAAVSDTELRPAFANLVRATGSVTEAQELMTLALDVAAGTGRDLESVTEALQEAIQGEVGPLKELDRSLTDMIASGADADEVMGQLAETFGGAAARNTETVAGRFELMQIQIQNAQESIGLALLPILEKLLPILEDVATFVAENTDLFIAIGAAIATVAGIVIAYNTALKLYAVAQGIATAATALFNAVLAANPIVLIVLAIAGLIAGLILLEKRFGVVTKIVEGVKFAFDLVSDAVSWLAGKFVDFINTLIDVANKIPFVSIDKLTNVFEEQAKIVEEQVTPAIEGYADAELEVAEAIAEAAYQQQLANLDYEEAERLMDELHPTLDDVTAAIGRTNDAMARHHEAQQFISDMNTDLIDEFNYLFGIFDNDEAVDNFSDAILDAAEAVKEYGEGSREAEEASRDVYRELGKVIDQLDNIPATKQLELIALLDQGEYDAVLAQLQVLNAIANTALTTLTAAEIAAAAGMVMPTTGIRAQPVQSVDIGAGASTTFGQTPLGSPMNVVINMPAGTNEDDVVNAMQKYARKNGAIPVAIDDTRRF
jgi:hypothetical protein